VKNLLPQTQQSLWHLEVNGAGSGMRLNKEVFLPRGIIPVYSEEYDSTRHRPSQIDYKSAKTWVTGVPHITHKFGLVPLRVEVVASAVDPSDHPSFAESKEQGVAAVTDLVESSLPGMGDHVVRRGVVALEDLLAPQDEEVDLRIAIGDFAGINAGIEKPRGESTPTVFLKVNHKFEREVPAGMGPVNLDGKQSVDTDDPEELARYNSRLDMEHEMTLARLRRLGFVTASTVIDRSSGHEHSGVAGLSVKELDETLAEALNTVSRARR
jgi:hypothetical protein